MLCKYIHQTSEDYYDVNNYVYYPWTVNIGYCRCLYLVCVYAGNDHTGRPKLASGENIYTCKNAMVIAESFHIFHTHTSKLYRVIRECILQPNALFL